MAHHVYLIQSPEFPDLVKIGSTGRPVLKRIEEIEADIDAGFEVVFALRVPDQGAEGRIHRMLVGQRVLIQDGDRYRTEFFRVASRKDWRNVEAAFEEAVDLGAIPLAPPTFTRAMKGFRW